MFRNDQKLIRNSILTPKFSEIPFFTTKKIQKLHFDPKKFPEIELVCKDEKLIEK